MKDDKSLSEKIKELDEKTSWFYSNDFELEDATERYKEAIALAKEVEKDLNELQNEIEVLKEDFSK